MADEQLNEQEIQFRKRARRRLVGAIVLVLLMVAVLPMLLDEQEPGAPQNDIAISIPSQSDTGFSPAVVPTPATGGETLQEPALPAPTPQAGATPETGVVQDTAGTSATGLATPSGGSAGTGTYLVQIGVFASAAKASALQKQLQSKGLQTSIETLADAKVRLRAGPFATRNEADKARESIRNATGTTGMVIPGK